MKRLMWGAVLFLITAAATGQRVNACDWKSYEVAPDQHVMVIHDGDTTMWISSDDEFVTVVSYADSAAPSEWM